MVVDWFVDGGSEGSPLVRCHFLICGRSVLWLFSGGRERASPFFRLWWLLMEVACGFLDDGGLRWRRWWSGAVDED